MGCGRHGFLNTSHMKNKRARPVRKEEPFCGLVKTSIQKERKTLSTDCISVGNDGWNHAKFRPTRIGQFSLVKISMTFLCAKSVIKCIAIL